MATIQTSPSEEYTLFLSRKCLLQCLNICDDSSNTTEMMLSDLVEQQQQLIFSDVRCIYEISSGTIERIERQYSIEISKMLIYSSDCLKYATTFFYILVLNNKNGSYLIHIQLSIF